MKFSVLCALLLAFVLVAAGCRSKPLPAPHYSPEMSALLQARQNGGQLDISDLKEILKREETPGQHAVEIANVPPPPGSADMYSYTILLDHMTGQYWIYRSGGIAGETKIFGPGNLPKQ